MRYFIIYWQGKIKSINVMWYLGQTYDCRVKEVMLNYFRQENWYGIILNY